MLRPGAPAVIEGRDAAFNGKYYVVGASHRYAHDGGTTGYSTLLRLTRQDSALYFFLPEVNDEVLVAFEHGDVSRPFVVGSLWDEAARPDEVVCGQGRQ